MRRESVVRRALTLLLVLAGIGAGGYLARRAVGVELTVDSVQAWVQGFGWKGPLVLLLLITMRHFVLMPSTLLMTVAGLCFGTLLGGVIGTVGVILTGGIEFSLLRRVRPARLVAWAQREGGRVGGAIERGAPMAVLLAGAIPPTPFTAFHCAAAFTTVSFSSFMLAVALGAAIRSFALSYFGAGLLSADPWRLVAGALVVFVLITVPLLHPGTRRRLLPSEPRAPEPACEG